MKEHGGNFLTVCGTTLVHWFLLTSCYFSVSVPHGGKAIKRGDVRRTQQEEAAQVFLLSGGNTHNDSTVKCVWPEEQQRSLKLGGTVALLTGSHSSSPVLPVSEGPVKHTLSSS